MRFDTQQIIDNRFHASTVPASDSFLCGLSPQVARGFSV